MKSRFVCSILIAIIFIFISVQNINAQEEFSSNGSTATVSEEMTAADVVTSEETQDEQAASEDAMQAAIKALLGDDAKDKSDKKDKDDTEADTMSVMTVGEEEGEGENSGSVTMPGIMIGNTSNSGALSATIPIVTPPGRNGIAPNLQLTYNSMGGNGFLGMGFNIGLGAIQRSTRKGLDLGASGDGAFVFIGANGSSSDLVLRQDWGQYYYGNKIEGSFTKFYNPNPNLYGWVATSKDGTNYYYGTTNDSKLPWSGALFKWYLDRVEDTNGNFMTVTYLKDYYNYDHYCPG